MLGYIPSPSTNGFNIGPLRLHAYGFLIVVGVFAAIWVADRRWKRWGGDAGTFSNIAVWAVPGGLIGARLYSVITDYELYDHNLVQALEVWKGGLGIWGGIAGGVFGGWLYIRRHHLDFGKCLDCVAPALPLAQAIGRWGNYFNQELFGRPTKLPWGLKIDPTVVSNLFMNVNRATPPAYLHAKAFQPTFLYESLWDLAVVLLVLLIEKRVRLNKGYLFWCYAALYTFGRFFTEYLRIDFAHKILGLRLNDWTSILVFAFSATLVLTKGLSRAPDRADDREGELVGAAVGSGASLSGGPTTIPGGDTLDEDDIAAVIGRPHRSEPSEADDEGGEAGLETKAGPEAEAAPEVAPDDEAAPEPPSEPPGGPETASESTSDPAAPPGAPAVEPPE
ncbi:MAG: prolipoprotein diacylglyceryl transferase [Acidimicrobiales bacterium]